MIFESELCEAFVSISIFNIINNDLGHKLLYETGLCKHKKYIFA